jgi:hypothetical protein
VTAVRDGKVRSGKRFFVVAQNRLTDLTPSMTPRSPPYR